MGQQMTDVGATTKKWADQNSQANQFKDSCDSTNDWAKSESDSTNFCLFLTNHQVKGRGRGSNDWEDQGKGQYLLSSWSFKTDHPPQPITSPLFGLAVFNAAREVWPSLEWSLKAPNDIYLSDNKVGGILMETVQKGNDYRLIAGIGINVLSSPENVSNAGYITDENGTGGEITNEKWEQFLSSLLCHMQSASQDSQKTELSMESREALVEALNLNPLRPGVVLEVSALGDIVMENQTLRWMDL